MTYIHEKSTTKYGNFISKLTDISLEDTEDKANVQSFENEYKVLITPFSESYFIKMLNALIKNKIISTAKQLNDLGKLFKINEPEIKKLAVDLYIKKRSDEAAEHTSTFKWLFSCCCFFNSTSRTVKLAAAETLKKLLDKKEEKNQESKITFTPGEKEALADGSLSDLVTELGIRARIK